jgi:nitrogen regulatory protein PII
MRFKLILAVTDDAKSERVLDAARAAGGTGATIIGNARGEGLKQTRGVFGLEIFSHRDVLLFLVEEHLAQRILEAVAEAGEFDDTPGTGIAIQIDVEDALGVRHQIESLSPKVEESL